MTSCGLAEILEVDGWEQERARSIVGLDNSMLLILSMERGIVVGDLLLSCG